MLQIRIGNVDYNCSCVRYVLSAYHTSAYLTADDHWFTWPIGLSVGFFLPVVVVVVVTVVVVCRRRRNRPNDERNDDNVNGEGSIALYEDIMYESYYATIPDEIYCSTGPVDSNENDEYKALDVPNYLTILSDDEC